MFECCDVLEFVCYCFGEESGLIERMAPKNMRVVVQWTRDKKVGIEPIARVPENHRFAGAVTSVQYSVDKKWYPAKVIMIGGE